eukprot:3198973-Amphidinium_carterae.1
MVSNHRRNMPESELTERYSQSSAHLEDHGSGLPIKRDRAWMYPDSRRDMEHFVTTKVGSPTWSQVMLLMAHDLKTGQVIKIGKVIKDVQVSETSEGH